MMPQSLALVLTVTLLGAAALAQTSLYPGRCETAASQRTSDAGCYLDAVAPTENISGPVFWHLHTYATMQAAQAARGKNATAIQAFNKFWVFTLAPEAWRPSNGERVAVIGPLHIKPGTRYTARYMESTLPPGVVSATHTHSGPEAFYVLSGAQCLETPAAVTVSRAGESTIVDAGPPMAVSTVGAEPRRALFLVLHNSSEPWMARESTWSPSGRCPH